jgi:pyruvate decarboxylase
MTEYLFTRLHQLGVRSVQGVPGDFNLPALDYIESTGLKWAGNSAELSAGYAADGYARIKGIGALMTVFGVGELSAVNAIAGSFAEKVPVVHIVGTTSTKSQDENLIMHHSLGNGDHRVYANVAKHFTCAQANLRDVRTGPAQIDKVLRTCVEESRPVYIELPFDMINKQVCALGLRGGLIGSYRTGKNPDLEGLVVQDILRRLYDCRQPVIVVDGFAKRYNIAEEVNQLLNLTQISAVTPPFGQGLINPDYSHYCGVWSGPAGSKSFLEWFGDCDLVMHIAPLKSDSNTCSYNTLSSPAITIELDEKCISVFGAQYHGLQLQPVLEKLLRLLEPSQLCSKDFQQFQAKPQEALISTPPCSEPIDQCRFWPYMSQFLRSGDIVVAEIGTSWSGTGELHFPPNTTFLKSGIWFSIGSALGACVGAAQAQREMISDGTRIDGRTILFEGDGSFQVTAQAVSDIIRNKLDVVIFVINNDGYTIERLIHGSHASYNWVQPWNYTEAASFFGGPQTDPDYPIFSNRVSKWCELQEVLGTPQMQSGKGFNLVEIIMEAQDSPEVLSTFIDVAKRTAASYSQRK